MLLCGFALVSLQTFQPLHQFLRLLLRIVPPIRGPDVHDIPAKAFEDALPEFVTIPRGGGVSIRRSITFDAEKVPSGIVWMKDREIDAVAGASDLAMNFVT